MEKLLSWATPIVASPTVRQAEQAQPWDDRKSQSSRVTREICPRRSGRTWRERMWNRLKWEKQMMSDTCRLVRPDAVVRKEHSVNGPISVSPSRPGSRQGVERLRASLPGGGSSPLGGAFVRLEPCEGRTFTHGSEGGVSGQPLAPTRRPLLLSGSAVPWSCGPSSCSPRAPARQPPGWTEAPGSTKMNTT